MRSRPGAFLCAVLAALTLTAALGVAPARAVDPTLAWNTFLGGGAWDECAATAVDAGGNVYVVGKSDAAWGSPIRGYGGGGDALVAKLSPSGALLWHTFLGGGDVDKATAVAVSGDGSIFVAGTSFDTWGSPLNGFTGFCDAYVAKLSPSGELLWHTFLGCADWDEGRALGADDDGGVVVAGKSDASWGAPRRPHGDLADGFVAKLTSAGALSWNTFLGGDDTDDARALVVTAGSDIYVAGQSWTSWGAPLRAHDASYASDGFVARLNSSGYLTWNTFLGGDDFDDCFSLAHDGDDVYAAGTSYVSWGSPVRPYSGERDAFAAKITSEGTLVWNTFLGGADHDPSYGNALAVDGEGNLYVGGESYATWGSPERPYTADWDAWVAQVDPGGALSWNTFLGGADRDYAYALALAGDGLVVAGGSEASWGAPLRGYGGSFDAFVARLAAGPAATTITTPTTSVTLTKYGATYNVTGTLTADAAGVPGKTVVLQRSTTSAAGPFTSTSVTEVTAADGSFSLPCAPLNKTWYRARFAGDADHEAADGAVVTVLPRASVSNPIAPSVMYRYKARTVYGSLKPGHKVGTYPVRIYKYRKVSGVWKPYGYVNAKSVTYTSASSKYSVALKLPYRGSWRLRAYHPADAGHAGSWSAGYDYVTVK